MIVGMDFGTTNSGMAVFDGQTLNLLPLDPANSNPRVARTALYVANDQTVAIGREAINRYLDENIGRSVRMQKVWMGEIDVRGADMHFVQDIYVWIDIFSPGRLMLSIKTNLRDVSFQGTVIGQFFYSLEKLVALYLMVTKARAETILGRPLKEVVLGRPVHFSFNPEQDKLAQSRLLKAALLAGYEKVYFQYEPVAAAYHYATTSRQTENILLFDFGGGTLDVTVMRLGPKSHEVLATGGIPIAGDVFDQKLTRAKLPQHFGEGATYGPRHLPIPAWIYNSFSSWQTIVDLQTQENRRMLLEMAQTSTRGQEFQRLHDLVAGNYGLLMFDAVEKAKRELSERVGTMIRLDFAGTKVLELVTRSEFEQIIHAEVLAVDNHLDEIVLASGLRPEQIDAVIRTGGSAQIPVFYELLGRKFGRDKVRTVDAFSSVTSGLGVFAHRIEQGEVEAQVYTHDDIVISDPHNDRPEVNPINLDWVRRRIGIVKSHLSNEPTVGLIVMGEGKQVAAATIPQTTLALAQPIPLSTLNLPPLTDLRRVITADLDEPILIATTRYRFLRLTARQLLDLQELGMSLFDLHRFGEYEYLTGVYRWQEIRPAERFVLVTNSGFGRPYFMENMRPLVEGPLPLTFDRLLPGTPMALLGTTPQQQLALVTEGGKGLRIPVGPLKTVGSQAINLVSENRLMAAVPVTEETELLLVTSSGQARRLKAEQLPLVEQANQKGKALLSRPQIRVVTPITPGQPVWLLTPTRLIPINPTSIPLSLSTVAKPLLKLLPGEEILTCLM
ncbi:MAG: Hsp70 family protein [Anaerolineae bacterium]|nr:Hsp70 family protein [Anaerolineae bacterium]